MVLRSGQFGAQAEAVECALPTMPCHGSLLEQWKDVLSAQAKEVAHSVGLANIQEDCPINLPATDDVLISKHHRALRGVIRRYFGSGGRGSAAVIVRSSLMRYILQRLLCILHPAWRR